MKIKKSFLFISILCLTLLITACGKKSPTNTPVPVTAEPPSVTQPPTEAPVITEAPTAAGLVEDPNALPADPQMVTFKASDGTELQGIYYPSAKNPAPLVIMMHWINGDKADWNEVAPWLQNRGLKNPFPNPGDPATFPWWDPSWFPAVPADQSYAVLTFTFRNCLPMDQRGCPSMDLAGWLQDAKAAALFGRSLEGVDPTKIVIMGSSIGADGAADACDFVNQQFPGTCQGSLSLSPGSFLGVSYQDTIKNLGKTQPPTTAWCLADEGEYAVCEQAESAGNTAFKGILIPGGDHGNMLMSPNLDPLPMQLILDFLDTTLR